MPLALVATGSRPDSPVLLMSVRLIARLTALRTTSWFIGHVLRFGIRLFVLTPANHTLWPAPLVNALRPVRKLPAQSSWLFWRAARTALLLPSSGNWTCETAGAPPPTFHGPPQYFGLAFSVTPAVALNDASMYGPVPIGLVIVALPGSVDML